MLPALSLLSLVLCLSTALLSFRSHWTVDIFTLRAGPLSFELMFPAGVVHTQLVLAVPDNAAHQPFWSTESTAPFAGEGFLVAYHDIHPDFDQLTVDAESDKLGFGYLRGSYDFLKSGEQESGYNIFSPVYGIHAPAWAAVFLFAALPTQRFLTRHRRHSNLKRGACLTCNYDLTGNTSGVCPRMRYMHQVRMSNL